MKGSITVGKIKGIEIQINISWLVIFGLVTYMLASSYFPVNYPDWGTGARWVLSAVISLMLFASVLLHELSHSLVSISLGVPVKKISLFIFGGVAEIEKEPDSPSKELKIAAAGPAMSIFIFIFFTGLAIGLDAIGAPETVVVPLSYVASMNLVLAIFNLVPAFPLDGGRVLRATIWQIKGDLQLATRIASSMGTIFGYLLIFTGVFWVFTGYLINGIWFMFIGWFLTQSSQSSYQNMVLSDIFNKIPVGKFMSKNVVTVNSYISVQELVDSYFYSYKFAVFPVKKNEDIVGIVNLESVKKIPRDEWNQTAVDKIATPIDRGLIVSPESTVSDAMTKLFSNSLGRVLVMDGSKLVGIVSRTDILNYIRIYSQVNGQ